MKGEFFAVGLPQFLKTCQLGMNPAIAFLVMARGSLSDNTTTSWSAQSIFNYTGIARRRAKEAITNLVDSNLVEQTKGGTKPKYTLQKPRNDKELAWLPSTLVDGAGREVPPLMRLREVGDVALLRVFIELYNEQDLESDGGIPRTLAWTVFRRSALGEIGPFTLYGFDIEDRWAAAAGILGKFHGQKNAAGCRGAWIALRPLIDMGLVHETLYMAESQNQEAELIYPVTEETEAAVGTLLQWINDKNMYGLISKVDEFERLGVALTHIKHACLVGGLRLHYRAKTSKTSRWWARERQQVEAMVGLVNYTCHKEDPIKCADQG